LSTKLSSQRAEDGHRRSPLARVLALGRRAAIAVLVVSGCKGFGGGESTEVRALIDQMLTGRIGRAGLAYDIVYRLYVPPGYDASRRYPLVLFLHGSGALGSDNRRQVGFELARLHARVQAKEPAFVLAPQCPEVDKWVTGARQAPYLNFSQAARPESDAIKLVVFLLDELAQKYPLDPERFYVTGHSSGASGTWDLVSRRVLDRFAAAVPVTGIADPSRASAIAKLPLWIFHGARDEISPVKNARDMAAALRAQGSAVRYTEYSDVGHDSLAKAYQEPELVPWLLAQRRARSAP
jgi:predicted peptidase